MIVAVADTHTALWYLFSDPRLGKAASAFIDDTIVQGNHIGVSAITLAEMVYLVEKARIPSNALNDLHAALTDPRSVLQHIAVDEAVAMKMTEVSRQDIPDLPDRVIAATAYLRGVPRPQNPFIRDHNDLVARTSETPEGGLVRWISVQALALPPAHRQRRHPAQ